MTVEFHQVLPDITPDEVFGWHERPGAIARLTPPWQPVRVMAEAESLRDGRAVLRLPGGLRWVAQHQADAYRPDRQFADRLTSLPLRWRHTHVFEPTDHREGGGGTLLTDRVDTVVPARFVRSMFGYRHTQLADDLNAHRWARELQEAPLTVAMTGSSGLIGSALTAFLTGGGHRVIRLVRRSATRPEERLWRPEAPDPDLLRGVDAVVHLAGASIGGRFTRARRDAIRDSRIEPTRKLAALAANTPNGPSRLVAASAIGFYGADRGDESLTEDSERGEGFLADVVADWEEAARVGAGGQLRVVCVRTGIVQSPAGGMLRLARIPAEAGLAGRVGDGTGWMSWIGIDDLLDVYYRALTDPRLAGAVNATAPQPARQADYMAALARVLLRPAPLAVPTILPRLALGEQATSELVLASQRVLPARLAGIDHAFRRPVLDDTLRHLLGRTPA